jgi:hypothetical protein
MPGLFGPFSAAGVAFACIIAAALGGAYIHRRLPSHHLEPAAAEAVKLVMGLVATIAAMVLGLLTATAQSTYTAAGNELQEIAADITELDRLLAYYGPEASEARRQLREMTLSLAKRMEGAGDPSALAAGAAAGPFFASIGKLTPQSGAQHFIQEKAFALTASLRRSRAIMDGQEGGSVTWPFLGVLIFWLGALFFGFAIFVRLNATVLGAFFIGALSVASAIFLILELEHPNHGLMAFSSAPLRAVLAEMGPSQ